MENLSSSEAINRKMYNIAYGLAIFTIIYNIVEGLISIWLGYADKSLALFGFGTDSFVEFISGLGIAHMIIRIRKNPGSSRDDFEKRALRVTGVAFYILTIGLTISSIYNIVTGHRPENTIWGVIISLISIAVMLVLIAGKTKAGKKLNSDAILADAQCTRVCVYMSLILLASSGIYKLTGFPYIDSIGTLGLAYLSFGEGKECFERIKNNANCSC
jgi:divalent metal cation (Fe/Co/Zn/Cd) transporter